MSDPKALGLGEIITENVHSLPPHHLALSGKRRRAGLGPPNHCKPPQPLAPGWAHDWCPELAGGMSQ